MKSIITNCLVLLFLTISFRSNSQTARLWTENDRMYLVENLRRTKFEIINETKDLTPEQWDFREDSAKWSIGQVLDYI